MNKKVMTLVAAGALAALIALAGCGSSQTSSSAAASASAATSSSAAAPASTSAAASAAAPASSSAAAPASSAAQGATADSYIGEQAARDAAFAHAGLADAGEAQVSVKLDSDDAVVHYDVEIKVGNTEYDYDIDAKTGAVLSFDSEIDND